MAFNQESEYLDLKKAYQNFYYQSLFSDQIVKDIDPQTATDVGKISQNTYLFVQEKEILVADIKNMCIYFQHLFIPGTSSQNTDLPDFSKRLKEFPFTKIKDRVSYIIQKYQEQSVLLDPLMENMVTPLMQSLKEYLIIQMKGYIQLSEEQKLQEQSINMPSQFHDICSIVYLLTKVCNYKYINKFFPHEVKDLEPVIYFLVVKGSVDIVVWETKYTLLLWLAIIVLVPFDLVTIDSRYLQMEVVQYSKTIQPKTYINDICNILIELGKFYLNTSTKMRDASAVFLSNFFSRTDIQHQNQLGSYIQWCQQNITNLSNDMFFQSSLAGIYSSLGEIFKIGQRKELLKQIPRLMEIISFKQAKENTTQRHLKTKLTQRIGMVYLRPRAIDWAYRKGQKSLLENLTKTVQSTLLKTNVSNLKATSSSQSTSQNSQSIKNYYEDVDFEQLETIIDFLIEQLHDKDTVVRWSAAKGIGRITSRLDLEMADDIVTAVVDLFSPNETEATWHGGCLTIGELSRRGLLLPKRVKDVFPIIYKALHFEINQGTYSLGSNVRDAACYIAWAFARAYDPQDLLPYVSELSQKLLLTCIFDREVNCRRAASAAFQEHVGRQGYFPHGIDILTEADYFTLGLIGNAYLNIAPFIASYPAYFTCFVENLAFSKLKHWELELRRLAAASLSVITPLNPEFVASQILPGLIKGCTSEQIAVRHGALYGVGDILCGLAGLCDWHNMKDEMKDSVFLKTLTFNEKKLIKAGDYMERFKNNYDLIKGKPNLQLVEENLMGQILNLVADIEKLRLFRGKGGEFMRIAVCRFIQCVSFCKIPLKPVHLKRFQETLEECIKSFLEEIQTAAVKAFSVFSATYHLDAKPEHTKFVKKLCESAKTEQNIAIVRGYSRALGVVSKPLLEQNLSTILEVLTLNCQIKTKDKDDADTRKFTIKSLENLIETLGFGETSILTQSVFDNILDQLLQAFNDYTMDNRGDIGSLIREQAMSSLNKVVKVFSSTKDPKISINSSQFFKIIQNLLQQLSEKIDRVRLVAGTVLQNIFDNVAANIADFQLKDVLKAMFGTENIKQLIQKDQDKIDTTFETKVIEAELKLFLCQQTDIKVPIYDWNQPQGTYFIVLPLLRHKLYNYSILKGLCVSVGGLSESVSKFSRLAFKEFLKSLESDKMTKDEIMKDIFDNCMKILTDNANQERIIIPMFKMMEFLLERNEIHDWPLIDDFTENIYQILHSETIKTLSIGKLSSGVGVLIGLLNLNRDTLRKRLLQLVQHSLFHKYPTLRKLVADRFYMYLMANGDDIFGSQLSEDCSDFLLENHWLAEDHKLILTLKNRFNSFFQLE